MKTNDGSIIVVKDDSDVDLNYGFSQIKQQNHKLWQTMSLSPEFLSDRSLFILLNFQFLFIAPYHG